MGDGMRDALEQSGTDCITVAVRRDRGEVVAVRPGYDDTVHGLAVDIGSTTIAVYLCDLHRGEVVESEGAMNPQIRFGEDLMSRVSYVMLHEEGGAELTRVLRTAVADLVADLLDAADVDADRFRGDSQTNHVELRNLAIVDLRVRVPDRQERAVEPHSLHAAERPFKPQAG